MSEAWDQLRICNYLLKYTMVQTAYFVPRTIYCLFISTYAQGGHLLRPVVVNMTRLLYQLCLESVCPNMRTLYVRYHYRTSILAGTKKD